MFKIHPKVPECMSDTAKCFIMNCFTPNPDDRATAAELLGDPFLRSSPRKKARAQQETESKDFLNSGEALVHIQIHILLFCLLYVVLISQFIKISYAIFFLVLRPLWPMRGQCCCDTWDCVRFLTLAHKNHNLLQPTISAACPYPSPSSWRTPIPTWARSTCPVPWTSGGRSQPSEQMKSPRAHPAPASCRKS